MAEDNFETGEELEPLEEGDRVRIHREGFDGEALGTVTETDQESEEVAVHPDPVPDGLWFERADLELVTRADDVESPDVLYSEGDRVLDETRAGYVDGEVVGADNAGGEFLIAFDEDEGVVERGREEISLIAPPADEA
ncbi:hypothetical protein [Haloarcula pelagica]|uniref:hypothetical protein n=1 Tax=Haloarcula pelagica TaxID=3033389 RepID=UPI0024C43F69|nr:hypothetical protein [Halomicroarcula sp. YJ-61-S]